MVNMMRICKGNSSKYVPIYTKNYKICSNMPINVYYLKKTIKKNGNFSIFWFHKNIKMDPRLLALKSVTKNCNNYI